MKTVVLHTYRSPLIITEEQSKQLHQTEVRITTAYAGISFTDRIIQQGLYTYQRQHMPLPYTPGFEASGVVSEVGQEVLGLETGDRVAVMQRSGCLSSEIIAQQENVIKLPHDVDLAWAASLPVNFFTANHALNNIVKVYPDSTILVTSAAGGVGGMLTQLASKQHLVTGLVGVQSKKEYVQALGAAIVCTYEEFSSQDIEFDLILVASGKDLDSYMRKLTKNGKMVIYGFHSMVPKDVRNLLGALVSYLKLPTLKPFRLVYENKTVSGFNIIHLNPESNEFRAVKKHFMDLMESGNMPKGHKIHEYQLENVNQALEDLASGSVEGKIVVKF